MVHIYNEKKKSKDSTENKSIYWETLFVLGSFSSIIRKFENVVWKITSCVAVAWDALR